MNSFTICFWLCIVFKSDVHDPLRRPYEHKTILFLLSQWSSLIIDLVSFTGELFKGFLKLDAIALFASCKVRRVFTMKTDPKEMSDDGNGVHHISHSCQFIL